MAAAPRSLSEQFRDAIRRSGRPVSRIARDAGVSRRILFRFLSGERGMMTPTLDKVGAALGLGLTASIPAESDGRVDLDGVVARLASAPSPA